MDPLNKIKSPEIVTLEGNRDVRTTREESDTSYGAATVNKQTLTAYALSERV